MKPELNGVGKTRTNRKEIQSWL